MYRAFALVVIFATCARRAVALNGGLRRSTSKAVAVAERQSQQTSASQDIGGIAVNSGAPDEEVEQRLVRPRAGQGVDTIKFGLAAKNFYGTNLKTMSFKVDVVVSLRWRDHRVVGLIPDGLDKLVMSTREAQSKVWMPGVVVTNRDIDMYEIISSSVSIFASGKVLRVERAMVRVLQKFALDDYPFDTQLLKVILASSRYMSDEVVLVPSFDRNVSGVDEHIWGDYDLQSWATTAFEEYDGELRKSRGMIEIELTRNFEKYRQDHLVPSMILIVISWAVFYFPFAGPFITPRLALSILALLTFTNLIIKSGNALPGAAPFNWNDLFNQQIQILMFATIVINITTEVIYHQLQMQDVGRRVNHEAKLVMPVLTTINVVAILTAAFYKYVCLATMTFSTQLIAAISLGMYAGWICYITRAEIQTQKLKF